MGREEFSSAGKAAWGAMWALPQKPPPTLPPNRLIVKECGLYLYTYVAVGIGVMLFLGTAKHVAVGIGVRLFQGTAKHVAVGIGVMLFLGTAKHLSRHCTHFFPDASDSIQHLLQLIPLQKEFFSLLVYCFNCPVLYIGCVRVELLL